MSGNHKNNKNMDDIEELMKEAHTTPQGVAIARKTANIFKVGTIPLKLRASGKERRVRRSTFDKAVALVKMYKQSCIELKRKLDIAENIIKSDYKNNQ